MKKKTLKKVGETEDGKVVMGGVFHEYASRGLPLATSFMIMSRLNMVPSAVDLYEDAVENGWNQKTIMQRFEEAYVDGYGQQFWEGVKQRLLTYMQKAPT